MSRCGIELIWAKILLPIFNNHLPPKYILTFTSLYPTTSSSSLKIFFFILSLTSFFSLHFTFFFFFFYVFYSYLIFPWSFYSQFCTWDLGSSLPKLLFTATGEVGLNLHNGNRYESIIAEIDESLSILGLSSLNSRPESIQSICNPLRLKGVLLLQGPLVYHPPVIIRTDAQRAFRAPGQLGG